MPGHIRPSKSNPADDPDPTQFLYVSLEQKRIDATKPFDGKTACWVPDEKESYVLGKIVGDAKAEKVTVALSTGEERTFKNDQIQQVNPPKYEKCEDMSNLTHLNDASVLYNLKSRYSVKLIYTYSGLFCVAINPYKRWPIYTNRAIAIYKGRRRNEVPPHIFAIADGAYMDMLTNNENQSMLITGESGAGKTENTKKVIAYFAVVGASNKKKDDGKGSLEDQIVQTNPVLEAFGNAKTTRNDNSSRFGKFIRIHFGTSGKLAGADIETYLLEKARVISQQPLERSYHIFYQMMSGAVAALKGDCFLSEDIHDYFYVSQGKTTIPNIDDSEEMTLTDEAFDVLNFSKEEKQNIYRITAAVMHIGEMKFKQKGREEQAEADGTEAGTKTAKLLGIDGMMLYVNLTKPRIKVGNEFVTQGRNKDQCTYSLGALAKALFDRVFKFLVKKANMTLDTKQKRAHFIGVLDIAGFEIFEFNGFEQICINFTNEKLQQFFNHHMFVLEQEEYKREGIDWVFVDFGMDLQACIELMEKKMGVLAILEEESMFPKATDKTFEDKLNANHLGKSNCYLKPKPPKPGQVPAHFAIGHYAGTVSYNICGWLEKNKDPLNDSVVDQFKKGSNQLVIEIFADHPGQSAPADSGGGKGRGKKGGGFATVSSAYKEQLNGLMKTLNSTQPHFIRCIIPNELKQSGVIDSHLVMHQLTCNGVLEGIRICRKGFPNRMVYPDFRHRYQLLAAQEMAQAKSDRESAAACFDKIQLDKELFRLGHTKVFFRAGVLGQMEEFRDERLSRMFTWLQSWIRGYFSRHDFQKLCLQRDLLLVVQRVTRAFLVNRNWAWFKLWQKLRPILHEPRIEEEIKAMEEEADRIQQLLATEVQLREKLQQQQIQLNEEKADLMTQLESSQGNLTEFYAAQERINAQKQAVEKELNDAQERLSQEEQARMEMTQNKRKMEQESSGRRRDIEDIEATIQRAEQDKASKDHQIRSLNEHITQQDEVINKLNREKKLLQEKQLHVSEDLQSQEDKVGHMMKVRQKLAQTLEELEEALEREKRARLEVDKEKRRVDSDLRLTQEQTGEVERARKELEQTIARKDKEMMNLTAKLDDEQYAVSKLQKNVKDLQTRVEEIEEELETERQARAKSEKQRAHLARELEELGERLDEAGGATAAQQELNKKRDAELAKLRRELEQQNIQHDSSASSLRRKQQEAVGEMAEQVDQLNKIKSRLEKERTSLANEAHDARQAVELVARDKTAADRMNKVFQQQINEVTARLDEVHRTIADVDEAKKKLSSDNAELSRQLEEAESQQAQLGKQKLALSAQLDEARRGTDEEARERATILGKFRNLEHHLDSMQQQLDEEREQKTDLQRQVSKATADAQMWRLRFEQDGLARAEELEEIRRRISVRLQEAEEQMHALNEKNCQLEKQRSSLTGQMDDMHVEVDRAQQLANSMEKKARNFDKVIGEWKIRVDDLSAELDASQRECRNYSTELFRVRAVYDEAQDQLEGVRRENKALTDEIKELMDQIGEGGRTVGESEKGRRMLEAERDELQLALEEAESALEQEESRVLRVQTELDQVRQEIDRRVQEKDEEFISTRKLHQRQLESVQSSLEGEARARGEALRLKKKLEADIGELELSLERANKSNADTQQTLKHAHQQLRVTQTQVHEEQRSRDDVREQMGVSERRANALHGELEESRTLLEQADRARRKAETELCSCSEQLSDCNTQLASCQMLNRRLDGELQSLHSDLDEMLHEARNSDEKAKKAMLDAARLAEELRSEQEHAQNEEKHRKALETHIKDLQVRVDEAEHQAVKSGRRAVTRLEDKLRALETELDAEQRRHSQTVTALRKTERRIKELGFQGDEERKNHERQQDTVDNLQHKIKTYKRQIEEAEEIAALNLAKFRKCQQEMEEISERCELGEQTLAKFRARGRGASAVKHPAPSTTDMLQ